MLKTNGGDASARLPFPQIQPCGILLGEQELIEAGCETTRASHDARPSSILWIGTNVPYKFPLVLEAAGVSLGDMRNVLPTSAPCASLCL
jgi:hypothetical protein